ncbi:MocR-like pyridoxine biosynthesis transcription factor PdxR [Gordonia rhizosphera]|uniref:Putative GntR family transcriptional regulator n=1 Tax=Gordonia rhizosphera NBRC 16068 TaxID=1108045 RepID=K6W807_9ACTN|nr:PLP-dependent aminotransferase family protein [Gordonia rhizosphera]GAB89856.1 putative GntR family transcriptional regulator [Gordonia rhizosphera NBRC 16068]
MDSQVNSDPWEKVAQRLGSDLHLDLPPDHSTGPPGRGARRRHALAEALRAAIADGRLPAGSRLPPYRSLAADVGLARGTVATVYQELVAEGWLVARQGSGTRVADGARGPGPAAAAPASSSTSNTPVHNFALGQPNSSLFPRTDWVASTRRVMAAAPDDAFGPGHPRGSSPLRRALAGYLSRARGVRTDPDQIVLTTSVKYALELLSRNVFGESIAVESHGLPFHRQAIERGATTTTPIPIDTAGAVIDAIPDRTTAVLLTPSHQFPTGVALSPARRAAVVDWARARGGLVVEDDYDGELRYDRDPVGVLQALGPDVVIHTGSVSKSISPALRIAWLVLPPHLVDTVAWAKGIREPDASIVDQLILADMIETGAYDRHVRRSRQYYRRRRDHLTARFAATGVESHGIAAGLHAVIPVDPRDESAILTEGSRRGFAFAALSLFRHPDAPPPDDAGGIVVGFGTPSASTYSRDVDALVDLIGDYLPKRRLRAE